MTVNATTHQLLFAQVLSLLLAGSGLANENPAVCPTSTIIVSWEPFNNIFGNADFYAIDNNIDVDSETNMSQGYTLLLTYIGRQGMASAAGMDRASFDGFAGYRGVALINTHGEPHEIDAISLKTKALCEAWRDQGLGNSDMFVEFDPTKGRKFWYVGARSTWVAKNWAPSFNQYNSIVVVSSCNTGAESKAGTGADLLDSIGGRAAIGFDKLVKTSQTSQDEARLFQLMNGTLPAGSPGSARRIGDAYLEGGFTQGLVLSESTQDNTTLCPSVDHPIGGMGTLNIFPAQGSTTNGISGDGWVIFDSNLETIFHKASDVLQVANPTTPGNTNVSGNVTISNQTWVGLNRINFHWNAQSTYGYGGGTAYTLMLRVVAANTVSERGGQQLDGGTPSAYGVAPNGGDFTWSFSGH